jgi:predicted NUDIX family phosphoesterase
VKHNGHEQASVGIGGHGTALRKGHAAEMDIALRAWLEKRGLRTELEIRSSALTRRRMAEWRARK